MNYLKIAIALFILFETSNVIALYFFPDTWLANSIGLFKAWENGKRNPAQHDFESYLVNWVAGSELIFILLLVVILFTAGEQTLLYTGLALIIAIISFYWRLFPLIRKMDSDGQIEPRRYSAVLGWMIGGFILMFVVAVALSWPG